jgi:hypothetical protein
MMRWVRARHTRTGAPDEIAKRNMKRGCSNFSLSKRAT